MSSAMWRSELQISVLTAVVSSYIALLPIILVLISLYRYYYVYNNLYDMIGKEMK
jgi:hypothetical protein